MEIVLTIILSLAIALILTAILVYGFDRRAPGPLAGFLFFLVMLFLTVWVGSLWIEPIGPELYGIPWLAMLVIGLLVTLIITAVTAPAPEDLPAPDQEGIAPPSTVGWGCGLLFWMTITILMMAAVARYTWFATPAQ
jgi:hypothetical protein